MTALAKRTFLACLDNLPDIEESKKQEVEKEDVIDTTDYTVEITKEELYSLGIFS